MGVCMLCVGDSEERERGVGTGVTATMLSETPYIGRVAEAATRQFRFRKKPRNLCPCDSEERE